MARYFFHIDGETGVVEDQTGVEVADVADVRRLALLSTAEALRDAGARFWAKGDWRCWVTDETGATVCRLRIVGE